MTREEAARIIDGAEVLILNRDVKAFYKAATMAIKALRELDAKEKQKPFGEWISVKDRMPDADVAVLARCFYHECWQTLVCHCSKRNIGRWYTNVAGQWVQVTHWMPLPELPKEYKHETD